MLLSTKSFLLLLGLLLIAFPAKASDCGETAMRAIDTEISIARAKTNAASPGEKCKALRYLAELRIDHNQRLGYLLYAGANVNNAIKNHSIE